MTAVREPERKWIMRTKLARPNIWVLAFCAVLVLIDPVSASAGDNQESGIQPSQDQSKGVIRSGDESSAEWKTVGECLVAGDSGCVLGLLDQIIKEDPEAWEAYALRAAVREDTGDLVGAERDKRTLTSVGGTYAAIENRLSQAIDLNPADPDLV